MRSSVLLLFLLLSIATPLPVGAQQSAKLYRIGMLERASTMVNAANIDGFRQGLRELGYIEGTAFVIEYRSSDGRDERYPTLAAELVRLKVDLIVTRGTPAALAAKQATATIPVVITGTGDPVGQGIFASLARPGGNISGLSAQVTDIYAKRVQLLKELIGASPDKEYAHDERRQILLELDTTIHRDQHVVLAFDAPKQFAVADAGPTAAGYRIDTVVLARGCEV